MKVFLENYNGVLDLIEDHLDETGQLTDNPHQADCFILWQDVRGVCKNLAALARQLEKPVIVMQHGRGATRDYCFPNNFPLIADKIMVWGEADRQRLLKIGISQDRISVVGCPLFSRLNIQRPQRQGKNVLFVPVIAEKEEPENILVYAALKKWESDQLIKTVYANFSQMKKSWAWEDNQLREVKLPDGTVERRLWKKEIRRNLPRWLTYGAGLVNVKLSGVHDQFQYEAPLIVTQQNEPQFIENLILLLANIDAMVCLEEGTMQLMAHALNIPVVVVDIFRYENYGGCKDYDRVEKIHTNACYWTKKLEKIGYALDHALENPQELKKSRLEVCKYEGGLETGDCLANIIGVIESCVERKESVSA